MWYCKKYLFSTLLITLQFWLTMHLNWSARECPSSCWAATRLIQVNQLTYFYYYAPLLGSDDFYGVSYNSCCYNLRTNHFIMAETGLGKTADEPSYLKWNPFDGPTASDRHFEVTFKWNSALGVPGAFLIKNEHPRQFFLKSLTLDIPGQGKLHFKCNSWITPYDTSKTERIFFSNKVWCIVHFWSFK